MGIPFKKKQARRCRTHQFDSSTATTELHSSAKNTPFISHLVYAFVLSAINLLPILINQPMKETIGWDAVYVGRGGWNDNEQCQNAGNCCCHLLIGRWQIDPMRDKLGQVYFEGNSFSESLTQPFHRYTGFNVTWIGHIFQLNSHHSSVEKIKRKHEVGCIDGWKSMSQLWIGNVTQLFSIYFTPLMETFQ